MLSLRSCTKLLALPLGELAFAKRMTERASFCNGPFCLDSYAMISSCSMSFAVSAVPRHLTGQHHRVALVDEIRYDFIEFLGLFEEHQVAPVLK